MKIRLPFRLAAASGLWLSTLGFAQEPARLPVGPPMTVDAAVQADQQVADAVAARLAQTPHLRGYQVDIVVVNGSVDLRGSATEPGVRDEIVRVVRGVPNVTEVRDRLEVTGSIQPVNGQAPGTLAPPMPLTGGAPPAGLPAPYIAPPGPIPGFAGNAIDPAPINGPGLGARVDLNPPQLPPHAWPTYAPYNNYSRVAYPEEYPYASFPFIGPFYPFPKVPLGYRAIKLEWEDGHWFYGRNATKRDFWTVKYW